MKTAAELEIEQAELDALLAVRNLLASGTIRHHGEVEQGNAFNMGIEAAGDACGSVCCIGGWMSAKMQGALDDDGIKFDRYEAMNYVDSAQGELSNLFFPPRDVIWDDITVAQALVAIDNFTTTGKSGWEAIL